MKANCWPDPSQELLLKACFSPCDEAVRNWNAWVKSLKRDITSTDDRNILSALYDQLDHGTQRLLPLVYKRLSNCIANDRILGSIRGYYRYTWYKNQILIERLQEGYKLLQSLGFELISIKGIALSILYYKDFGARVMSDLDLVVKPEDADVVLKILQENGWRDARSNKLFVNTKGLLIGTRDLFNSKGDNLDLHWKLFKETYEPKLDLEIWKDKIPLQIGKVKIYTLNPTDHVLNILVHGIEGNKIPSIRWIPDILVILEGEEINWDLLNKRAQERKLTPFVQEGIAYLASHFPEIVSQKAATVSCKLKSTIKELKYYNRKIKLNNAGTLKNLIFRHCQFQLFSPRKSLIFEIKSFIRHYKLNWGINSNSVLVLFQILAQLMRLNIHPSYKINYKS